MNIVKAVENEQIKDSITDFKIGDTVKVHFKIIEGKTERIQIFEGVCIAKKRGGINKTFTVRKISYGVGVERIFPLNSPKIDKIEVVRRGRIRRSKLYYLRNRVGKAAKVTELIIRKTKKKKQAPENRKEKEEIKKTEEIQNTPDV
jgi:large subunit ribosomal protein L19